MSFESMFDCWNQPTDSASSARAAHDHQERHLMLNELESKLQLKFNVTNQAPTNLTMKMHSLVLFLSFDLK